MAPITDPHRGFSCLPFSLFSLFPFQSYLLPLLHKPQNCLKFLMPPGELSSSLSTFSPLTVHSEGDIFVIFPLWFIRDSERPSDFPKVTQQVRTEVHQRSWPTYVAALAVN